MVRLSRPTSLWRSFLSRRDLPLRLTDAFLEDFLTRSVSGDLAAGGARESSSLRAARRSGLVREKLGELGRGRDAGRMPGRSGRDVGRRPCGRTEVVVDRALCGRDVGA